MTIKTKIHPVFSVSRGNISVALWENTSQEGKPFYKFGLERSYRTDDDEWKTQGISLSDREALLTIRALGAAHDGYCDLPKRSQEESSESSS